MSRNEQTERRVVVVGGARTPFAKAGKQLSDIHSVELGAHAVDGLLRKTGVDPSSVDQLHFGNVVMDPRVPHLAREVVFRSRLTARSYALTYSDNCIAGTSAITGAHDAIALGRADVAIAGGVESMSNAPVLFSEKASDALRAASKESGLPAKLRHLLDVRPKDLLPTSPGVEEPSTGLSMGEHTELMVKRWKVSREAQDAIALRSHERATRATEDGRLRAEIHPLAGLDRDGLVRPDTSIEKLAALPTVFDRSEAGTLTAGNSSPLTDGASAVLLMSEARAEREGFEPLAYLGGMIKVAIDPADGLLMGPAVAVPRLLAREGLGIDDFDLVEMHEAFAGQIACNLAAWEQGWKEPAIGSPPVDRINVQGGSIAIGHPFAATGARIVTMLANELRRRDARRGLVSVCAAGAQAAALILERPAS